MSFTQTTLAKTSSGFAHIVSGGNWTYTSTTDDLATIEADGYFDEIAQLVRVGEVFQILDSTNEVELLEISVINPSAPRVETKKFVGSGSIADGSVTTDKLADLAVTNPKLGAVSVDFFNLIDFSVQTAKLNNEAVTTAKIDALAVTLAKLATGISPSHVVKFSEIRTTVGGAATEQFTFTGALVTDLVHTQLIVQGTGVVTILTASVLSSDIVAVEFSANPQNDAILLITILRAAV